MAFTAILLKIGLEVTDAVVNPIQLMWHHIMDQICKRRFCGNDDPFMPNYLEQLIIALGGKPVNYDLSVKALVHLHY